MLARLQALLARYADADLQEVVRGGAVALVMRVGGAAFNFAFLLLIARLLGAEETGLYALASSVVVLATVLGLLGLDQALIRFVAEAAERSRAGLIRRYVKRAVRYVTLASVAAVAVGWAAAPVVSVQLFDAPSLTTPLRIMLLAVPLVATAQVRAGALLGLRHIQAAQAAYVFALAAGTCLAFGGMAAGSTLGWWALTMDGVAWAYVAGGAAASVAGVLLWRQKASGLGAGGEDHPTPDEGRTLLRTSIPMLWVASMGVVNAWSSVFLLGLYSEAAEVGVFNVALRLAMLTSFVLLAVNSVTASQFATFHAREDRASMERVAVQSARLMLVVASPLLLAFFAAAPWCLRLFGAEFVSGAGVLVVLAAGQFVNVAAGSVGQVLAMTGHERDLRVVILGSAAVNVIGCVLLIPRMGALGAAVATAAASVLMNGLGMAFAYKRLGVRTHAAARLTP